MALIIITNRSLSSCTLASSAFSNNLQCCQPTLLLKSIIPKTNDLTCLVTLIHYC